MLKQIKLDPDTNSGRLTGKWVIKKRCFGGYNILVECKSANTFQLYWRKIKPEELAYFIINN